MSVSWQTTVVPGRYTANAAFVVQRQEQEGAATFVSRPL